MKIAVAGLQQPCSGLTRVVDRISAHLVARAEIVRFGFEPGRTAVATASHDGRGITLLPCAGHRFQIPVSLLDGIVASGVATIVVVGPALLVDSLLATVGAHPGRPRLTVVLYLPTEGQIVSDSILDVIAQADCCVLYTVSARSDIELLTERRRGVEPGYVGPTLHVVGHGVDRDAFHQTVERTDRNARREMRRSFWDAGDPDDVWILNVARPFDRKRLDLTIAGFAAMAATRDDVRLILHPGNMTTDIRGWVRESGASDKIKVIDGAPLSDERLNQMYNVCDVGLSTAMGEGWGLPTFEHAATGAAQIVPDHTSFRENWSGAATMMPCRTVEPIFYEFSNMMATTSDDVHNALASVLQDRETIRRQGLVSQARALEPKYTWRAVSEAFSEIILQEAIA